MILKFDEYINEARRNLTFDYFYDLVVKKLGWKYEYGNPSHKFFTNVKDENDKVIPLTVSAHVKHDKNIIDAAAFDDLKRELIKGFLCTGNVDQIKKVDWEYIKVGNPITQENSIVYKTIHANDYLNDIEVVQRAFKSKSSICVIKNGDGEYNLCKNENDKKPLLPVWYELFQYNKKGNICLGYTDEDIESDTFGDNLFEIKPDGTLGNRLDVDYVIENLEKSK